MAEINLLKNELEAQGPLRFLPKGMMTFYLVLTIFLVLVVGFVGMIFYQKNLQDKAREAEQKAQEVNLQISKNDKQRKEAIALQRKIENLKVMIDNHVIWTNLFSELEGFIYKNSVISSIQFDAESGTKLKIEGVVSNFSDLGKLILGLEMSEKIKTVSLENTGQSEGEIAGISFGIEVVFDQSLFDQKE